MKTEIKSDKKKDKLNSLRIEIQLIQFILIFSVTIFLAVGGAFINMKANDKTFYQSLYDTSNLITRLYSFTKSMSQDELRDYMDEIVADLPDVDVVSIVDTKNNRVYHTNHSLINSKYDGTHPEFHFYGNNFYTENDIGPSGPQLRAYSAIYDEKDNYQGFIMTIRLKTSMKSVTLKTITMFLFVTLIAIILEIIIGGTISKKIKVQFLEFTEDFEGTRFLVDSMRANNHDFTNKLHVILGLIQIGEYDKAVSYIENISIIQRETLSKVMKSIENPSFAALLIGKIARASECNVRFLLQENICYREDDVGFPSEALVTIVGNLIDNALDAMNLVLDYNSSVKELLFGVFTKPGELLITVQDSGCGISEDIKDKVFEKGFSTKGDGRGVGLYHTKQLIESLGGVISFESQKGKGTCFMVSIKR